MKFYSGLPETRCGCGSTLEATKEIIGRLSGLFAELGIKTLLDAPCGDFNWMAKVDMPGIDYTGCDIDPENIAAAKSRDGSKRFILMDIVAEPPPPADLTLCREFLQHVPNHDAKRFLSFVKGWLLVTNYDNEANRDIRSGDFRETNLTKPPFNLPHPIMSIPDGAASLGLWRFD